MGKQPSQEEIPEYLAKLNELSQSWTPTLVSDRAKSTGIANYLRWFREQGIVLNHNGKEWEIAHK